MTGAKIRLTTTQYACRTISTLFPSRIGCLASSVALALLTVLASLRAEPAVAQESFEWYPIFKPAYFYSPSAGFGVGAGIDGRHLLASGDAVRMRTRVQQFRQSTSLGWASGRPGFGWSGWMVNLNLVRNLHEGFYGEGPSSAAADEQVVHRQQAVLELRRSQAIRAGAWIQPRIAVRLDHLLSFRSADPKATPRAELTTELRVRDDEGARVSFEGGIDAGLPVPQGAFQVSSTLRATDGSLVQAIVGVVVDRTWLLGNHRTITARLMLDRTVYRSDAIPYYFLPRLDDRLAPGLDRFRFYGNDRVVIGATYVHPIVEILKSHAYEGMVNFGLSQVYGDVLKDFGARLAIAPDRTAFAGSVPLEPTMGIGSRLVSRQSGLEIVSVILGFSGEGLQAGTLRITQRLSDWYSVLR